MFFWYIGLALLGTTLGGYAYQLPCGSNFPLTLAYGEHLPRSRRRRSAHSA